MKTFTKLKSLKELFLFVVLSIFIPKQVESQTIALWLFDEPQGLYPSHVIDDASENDYPLVIGRSGKIVKGKYGNALDATAFMELQIPNINIPLFGMGKPLPVPAGRTTTPMNWENALFTAIMTSGENHLRKEIGMVNATDTRLNLGDFDWTIDLWFSPTKTTNKKAVIFEIGEGPLREKNEMTSLSVSADKKSFILENNPSQTKILIKSNEKFLNSLNKWHHYTFTYNANKNELNHYVDGKKHSTITIKMKALNHGDESYFSLGRNGFWEDALNGMLDEVEFYQGVKDQKDIKNLESKSLILNREKINLHKGLPLLFANKGAQPFQLGERKHLFIDDAFIERMDDELKFVVNPPKKMEQVIGNITGQFRKHLTVVEDEKGVIRIYNSVDDDYLAVRTSTDGIHFTEPDFGNPFKGKTNIVIKENVGGLGNPFIDPNGPDSERWKYFKTGNLFIYITRRISLDAQ